MKKSSYSVFWLAGGFINSTIVFLYIHFHIILFKKKKSFCSEKYKDINMRQDKIAYHTK